MIVIAGAAGEIGGHLAKRFAEEGNRVIALDKEPFESSTDQKIESLSIDFGDEEAIDAIWQKLDFPHEVTLLNLIGQISTQPLLDIFRNWEIKKVNSVIKESFGQNLFSVIASTMSFIRFSLLSGTTPHVINFGSVSSEGVFGQLAYGSAKGAVQAFSRVASVELGIYGVRINCIMPGYVDTPKLLDRVSPERLEEITEKSTLRKLVSLEDIFLATKFLHDSRTLNGIILEAHSIYGR